MPSTDFQRALSQRGFTIKDIVGVLHHDLDPTIGLGYDAPAGSILLVQFSALSGSLFIKTGVNDIDWIEAGSGGVSTPTVTTVAVAASASETILTFPDTLKSGHFTVTIYDNSNNVTTFDIKLVNSNSIIDFTEYAILGDINDYVVNVVSSGGFIIIDVQNTSITIDITVVFNQVDIV